jgi:hypothetical protein
MDDWFTSEEFARAPIPRVLAEVWRLGLSGSLYVKAEGVPKCLSFDRGALVLDPASFEEKDFLRFLLTTGETDLIALGRVEDYAQKNDIPVLRALVETPLIAPTRLWSLLESYIREEALALVAARDAEREFLVRSGPPARVLVGAIDVPGLVLEGARRLEDPAVVDAFLPADGETVRRLPFGSPGAVELSLTERYVLGLLDTPKTLAEVCDASDVGRAETRRILFAFLCLGLAGAAGLKPKTGRLPSDLSLAGMDKILGLFNVKCSFIFKYISKEIGPVAFSVVEKALEEVRGRLDPVLQGAELKPDGRLEPRSLLKVNANIIGDESRRSLLRSMDEVLAAEVLAVKRTLGPAHESALVRGLEKIGEGA